MIETSALWDYEAMKKRQAMLPPWSPAKRMLAWRELALRADHRLTTILREERITRADNISHYCRKCRGLGTKRHHAMCPKRGRSGNHGNGVYVVTECGDVRTRLFREASP